MHMADLDRRVQGARLGVIGLKRSVRFVTDVYETHSPHTTQSSHLHSAHTLARPIERRKSFRICPALGGSVHHCSMSDGIC